MSDDASKTKVKDNLKQRSTWIRLIYMVILAVAWQVAEIVFAVVVVLQFLFKLVTGKPLDHLVTFARALADYMAQIVRFQTFVTEDLAFPFEPWPVAASEGSAGAAPPTENQPASPKRKAPARSRTPKTGPAEDA
jgi:hypothetical protein